MVDVETEGWPFGRETFYASSYAAADDPDMGGSGDGCPGPATPESQADSRASI